MPFGETHRLRYATISARRQSFLASDGGGTPSVAAVFWATSKTSENIDEFRLWAQERVGQQAQPCACLHVRGFRCRQCIVSFQEVLTAGPHGRYRLTLVIIQVASPNKDPLPGRHVITRCRHYEAMALQIVVWEELPTNWCRNLCNLAQGGVCKIFKVHPTHPHTQSSKLNAQGR